MPQTNFLLDVAFVVEGPWESLEEIPPKVLLAAMASRLSDLIKQSMTYEGIHECFGFCDSYEVPE
jgi:hypothetical protein